MLKTIFGKVNFCSYVQAHNVLMSQDVFGKFNIFHGVTYGTQWMGSQMAICQEVTLCRVPIE